MRQDLLRSEDLTELPMFVALGVVQSPEALLAGFPEGQVPSLSRKCWSSSTTPR